MAWYERVTCGRSRQAPTGTVGTILCNDCGIHTSHSPADGVPGGRPRYEVLCNGTTIHDTYEEAVAEARRRAMLVRGSASIIRTKHLDTVTCKPAGTGQDREAGA